MQSSAVVDAIDQQARERAEGWVSLFDQKVSEAEAALTRISGFLDDHTLGAAAVGSAGIKAGELHQQVPAIRQAIRDLDPDYRA